MNLGIVIVMLKEKKYDRDAVLEYARQWAMGRNPRYFDFEELGGDCTNFASQCIYAGSKQMNYKPTFGWYYNSSVQRSPSWSGVPYLYNFLVSNKSVGPYAVEIKMEGAQPGDIVQLGNRNGFYHSPVIVSTEGGRIYVAAHTYDAYMRLLDSYEFEKARFLHIQGVRQW
jgi:hypothetical protein